MKSVTLFRCISFFLPFICNRASCANVIPEETVTSSSTTKNEARPPTEVLLLNAVQARDYARAEALLVDEAEKWRYGKYRTPSINDIRSRSHMLMFEMECNRGIEHSSANKTDANGRPILHYAAELGDTRMVELLLDYWANVHATDRIKKTTALHLAAQCGHYDIAELLLRSDNIMLKDDDGNTPLQIAIDRSDFKMAIMMISSKHRMTAEVEEFLGWTNLHRAAFHGDMEMLRRLKCFEIIWHLNKRDRLGLTALHYAAMHDHEAIVSVLVRKLHIDINAVDVEGRTPLHYAEQERNRSVARVLVENRADASLTDRDGMTPKDLADFNWTHRTYPLLVKAILAGMAHKRELA